MKVTFCTREVDNVSGGQNTWLCRLLPSLRLRGIEPRVLCFTSSEGLPTVRSLRQSGISCTTVSEEECRYTEQQISWILNRLAEDPPDAFVAHMVIPSAYHAARWLREAGIPTVGICHGGGMSELYPGILDQFLLGSDVYRVAAFVTVSDHLEQDLWNRDPKGILIRQIPYGVPVPKDVAQKPNGRLRLAYVGQLVEERKRISDVTRTLCRAVRDVKGTEAFIYGDGPDRSLVQQILSEEGDRLPVHFCGFVENNQIQKYLLQCHAIVLLSDHEGLPVSVLEAMACGVIPIGLRGAPGVAELAIHDVTGLMVENRGDGVVAAVRRLQQEPQLWDRLAVSARSRVKTKYSLETCTSRWQELLQELCGCWGPRKPLRIPRRLHLPPQHSALAPVDHRAPRFHERLIRRGRRLVEWVK